MQPLPRYRMPNPVLMRLGLAMVFSERLSLTQDALAMERVLRPSSGVAGLEHVPASGPFVLAPNHWMRPGLWIGFPGAMLCAALSRVRPDDPPLHFVVTEADRLRLGPWRPRNPLTVWAYRQVALVYDMVRMPDDPHDTAARAVAVRETLRLVLPPPQGQGKPVCIFPEGTAARAGALSDALPGVGSLCLRLARAGVPILPTAIWETYDGVLRALVGPPLDLSGPPGRAEADAWARQRLMRAVAARLPPAYRGRWG